MCSRPGYLRLSLSWEFHGGCSCSIYRGKAPCGFKYEISLYSLVMAEMLDKPHIHWYECYFTLGINQYRGASHSRALIVVSKSIRFQRGSWNIPTPSGRYFRKTGKQELDSQIAARRSDKKHDQTQKQKYKVRIFKHLNRYPKSRLCNKFYLHWLYIC